MHHTPNERVGLGFPSPLLALGIGTIEARAAELDKAIEDGGASVYVEGDQNHLIRARLCATFPGGLPPPRTPPGGRQEPKLGQTFVGPNRFLAKNRSDYNGFR